MCCSSENVAAFISAAAILHRLIFIGIAVTFGIHVRSNVLFLSTSSHALHLLKLWTSSFLLLWSRLLRCSRLRSNLILFLYRLFFLRSWLFLLWVLRSCLLIILWIILGLVSWTYEGSILIRNSLLWGISLILVQITRLLWLETLFILPLSDTLTLF